MTFLGETSVIFPERPLQTNIQCNEDTDMEHGLQMSEETEERFEEQLSRRRMAKSFLGENLPDQSATSSESDEAEPHEQTASCSNNSFSEVEELWEDDDSEDDENMENEEHLINTSNATCGNIITALSFFILLRQRCFSISGVAISAMLKFLKMMFVMFGDLTGSELAQTIGNQFPVSLQTIKTLLRIDGNGFKIYAVCTKCNAIYEKQYCTKILPDGRVVTKTCTNAEWPNHPRRDNRSPCGEKLMKKVRGKTGNILWYPRKVAVF